MRVLEDEDKGREWLTRPQYGLGGRIPLEMATTEIGVKEVETLLGRIVRKGKKVEYVSIYF